MEFNKNMQICRCYDVKVKDITRAIEDGAKTLESVTNMTAATKACGSCMTLVRKAFEQEIQKKNHK